MFSEFDTGPFGNQPGDSDSDRAWRFAELIRGNEIHGRTREESEANARRKHLEWLAQFSPRHEQELNALQSADAKASVPRNIFDWMDAFSAVEEAWDSSKHPRAGGGPNPGWFASTGGGGGGSMAPGPHAAASELSRALLKPARKPATSHPTYQYPTQSALPIPGRQERDAHFQLAADKWPKSPPPSPDDRFRVAKHGDMPTPRPGKHSHHAVVSKWMEKHYPGYDPNKAPAILMSKDLHEKTYGVLNSWRARMAKKMGGKFDWDKVTLEDIKALSEEMFDVAGVPEGIRKDYWAEFAKMLKALKKKKP